MKSTSKRYKTILGRGEPVDFVDLDLLNVPAKVDTGAYRSAVHARNIVLDKNSGTLSFELLGGHANTEGKTATHETKVFKEVEIENSFGHRQKRYQVRLKVRVGDKVFKAGFTLADRSQKDFPILLGRTLLNRRFIVDTAHTNVDRLALKRHDEPSEETDAS